LSVGWLTVTDVSENRTAFRATVPVYQSTRRNNPNDMNFQDYRCANPKPCSRRYLPQNIQTCCRSLPNSDSGRPGGSVPKLKRSERESDHSISSNAKVSNAWSHTSTPAICLHSIHREYTAKPCRNLPVNRC